MHKDSPVQFGISLRAQTPKGLSGGFSGWLSFWFVFEYTYVSSSGFRFLKDVYISAVNRHTQIGKGEISVSFISLSSMSFLLIC